MYMCFTLFGIALLLGIQALWLHSMLHGTRAIVVLALSTLAAIVHDRSGWQ